MPSILSIDFETTSIADLKAVGAYNYARHPSTKVLCLAWKFDDKPVCTWRIGDPTACLLSLLDHARAGRRVRGWNAGNFEVEIWNEVFLPQIRALDALNALHAGQIDDTMIQAAYWGLPLSLDKTAEIIAPDHPKDKSGHRHMLKMSKPRTLDPITGKATWWHEDDPSQLDKLVSYCADDVEAEHAIATRLLPLPPRVRDEWLVDQAINRRGVRIDKPVVTHMIGLADEAKANLNAQVNLRTGGLVASTNQTARLLEWAKHQGYPKDNLRKDTVQDWLDSQTSAGVPRSDLQDVLEMRLDNAKTSVAKLRRMMSGAAPDDHRVRGMMQFYGAFRTGRWAGRLIQLQNMPRGEFKDNTPIVDALHARKSYHEIETEIGPTQRVVSSGLRACLVPDPGHMYVCADLGQIEARVVAWLAEQLDILNVFANGDDVYAYTASQVTGKPIEQCTKDTGPDLRNLGKVLTLACGFGMGGPKFQDTARKSGVILTPHEAQTAVADWRKANDMIVSLWWALDRAMRSVVSGQTSTAHICQGRVTLQAMSDQFGRHVLMVLPSRKRCLVYRNAEMQAHPDRPGETEITFMGLNQYTNSWERLRTYGGMLTENLVQATARDVITEGIMRCEADGLPTILTVHDELLLEVPAPDAQKVSDRVLSNLTKRAEWYRDLPVDAEAWVGNYYRK